MKSLIAQSRKYYRRFYRLVSCAVILMTAVLTGSLLLGDSVRGTLVQRVAERLGSTETIITTGTGFMSDGLMQQPLLKEAQGYLLMDGFVSIDNKLLPVYVWGTDADSLSPGEVIINEPLRAKLGGMEDIVLHLPSHNLVPSGSLFVTKSYATQMRVHVAGVKSIDEGGNLLLKNEQTLPLNIFVSRQELAEKMELQGKINLILSNNTISEEQLNACWTPELSGIHLTDSALTTDGIFIPNEIVEKGKGGLYFSYLVNDLVNGCDTIPYSFVTAVSEWQGEPLDGRDMILSDYAAKRLHVSEGDSVDMSYYVAKDLKNLETQARKFRVKRIVPLADFMRDSLLIAEFPGLSHVEKCTDWDSDLPINMERVTKEDEDFWYAYHQTPKAIVSYEAVSTDWSNAFGSATALRFTSRPDIKLIPHDAGVQVVHPRAQGLQGATGGVDFASLFLALGFFIILSAILLMKNPLVEMFTQRRGEIALYRQMGFADTTIFRNLYREAFTAMLCASPWGVLAGLLYSGLTLWLLGNVWSGATHTEGFALHIQPLTVIIGWLVALLICAAVLWWVIRLPKQMNMGGVASACSAPQPSNLGGIVALLILTIGLTAANFIFLHNMVLFIVCGLLWILTWGLFLRHYILRQRSVAVSRTQMVWQSVRSSLKQHLLAYWALALGVFTVFAVGLNRPDFSQAAQATDGYQYYIDCRVPIQYDLNNPAVRRKLSLESLPDSTQFLGFLRHTQDEASCLNLNQVSTPTVLAPLPSPQLGGSYDSAALPATIRGSYDSAALPAAIRGSYDSAALPAAIRGSYDSAALPASIRGSYDSAALPAAIRGSYDSAALPATIRGSYDSQQLLPQLGEDGRGLLIDEESLIWSLKKSVGDTLYYQNDRGETVPVVIAGTYPTGIFHGNAIMSADDFRRLWPKESGVEVLLMKSSRPDEAAEILSTAMNEYGLNIQTVGERIRMFFEVTETYLLIFLTLGGLGLLLGIFSLMIIVRKNLTAQAATIRQYRAMGFNDRLIQHLLLRENLLVPLYAVAVGATGSVISISANIGGAGPATLLYAALALAVLAAALAVGIHVIVKQYIYNKSYSPN